MTDDKLIASDFNILNYGYRLSGWLSEPVIKNAGRYSDADNINGVSRRRLPDDHPAMADYRKKEYARLSPMKRQLDNPGFGFDPTGLTGSAGVVGQSSSRIDDKQIRRLVLTLTNLMFSAVAIGFFGYKMSSHITQVMEFQILMGLLSGIFILAAECFLIYRALERSQPGYVGADYDQDLLKQNDLQSSDLMKKTE
ncbi:hypothetical protein MIR68_009363 [Amoeboaphelidium protococcarum]|nr:hypothetical protein MIR68_009363 [Amoeboaphelidium protococcarum]